MSWPSNTTDPLVSGYSRAMHRASVDLPQPDSPTRPSVSPARRSMLTSSTACTRATSRCSRIPLLIGKYFFTCSARSSSSPSPSPFAVAEAAEAELGGHSAFPISSGWMVVSRSSFFCLGSRWQASR